MSTVVTENLKRATEAVARSLRGVAASWLNFNGTGTVAIRDSQNVSSITDNGTGDFTDNFTAAMADAFYGPTGFCNYQNASPAGLVTADPAAVPTTAALRFRTGDSAVGSVVDFSQVSVTIHGDLA